MNRPCEEFADRIVEYVDGELPPDEARAVARHLAECEDCRQMAGALDRSLGLAKVLWSDNLSDKGSTAQSAAVHRCHRIRLYTAAASIFVAVSFLVFTLSNHQRKQGAVSLEQVEQQVAQTSIAAQLLAATQLIAQCEGTETIVQRQHQYILREYADTPAAKAIRAGLGSGGM